MSSPSDAAPGRSSAAGEETKRRLSRKRVTVITATALSLLEACGLEPSPSRSEEAAGKGKKATQGELPAEKASSDGLEAQQTASPAFSRKRDSGRKKRSAPDRAPQAVAGNRPEGDASQSFATGNVTVPAIFPVIPPADTTSAAVPPEPAISSPQKTARRRRAGSTKAAPVAGTGPAPASEVVKQKAPPVAGPSVDRSAVEAAASVPGEEQPHSGARRRAASRAGRASTSGGRGRKKAAEASPASAGEAGPTAAPVPERQAAGLPVDAAALAAEADRLAAEYGLSSSGGGLVVLPGEDDWEDFSASRDGAASPVRTAARVTETAPAAPFPAPVPVEAKTSPGRRRAGSTTTAAGTGNSSVPMAEGRGGPPLPVSIGDTGASGGPLAPVSGAVSSVSAEHRAEGEVNGPAASPVAGAPCATPSSGTGMGRREAAFRQWAADMQARFDAGLEAEEDRAARRKDTLVVLPPPTDTGGRKRRTAKKPQVAAAEALRPRAWITRRRGTEPGHEARFEEWHGPARTGSVLEKVFLSLGASPEQAKLSRLWRSWDAVLGADLAPLARPLGHHDDKLHIGAEDAVLLQELYYMGPEIVRRVNEFLQEDFFTAVKVSLMLDHQDLDAPSPVLERSAGRPKEDVSAPSGASLGLMDPESAVARCYARFLGMELPDPRK